MTLPFRDCLVLSDIDGTLVPHPYGSGVPLERRATYVARLAALCQSPSFGLVTGRKLAGFERLFTECGHPPVCPVVLGVEFGAHCYLRGVAIYEHQANAALAAIAHALHAALATRPEFSSPLSLIAQMAQGCIEGAVIEEKAAILQIDWRFKHEATEHLFEEFLFELLNPLLASERGLFAQVFGRRIDIAELGFVPKQAVWPKIQRFFSESTGKTLVLLGDELYDSYMFSDFLKNHSNSFADIVTCSVGRRLPHASRHFETVDAALDFVEATLAGHNAL